MNNMLSVLIGWALVPVIWAVVIWGLRDVIVMLKEHFGLTPRTRGLEFSLIRGVIFCQRLMASGAKYTRSLFRLEHNHGLSVTEITR